MKRLLILGAGTAGTMVANRMRSKLADGWTVTVIDPEEKHLYQPDLIFLPFGRVRAETMERPRRGTLGRGIEWRREAVERIDSERRRVALAGGTLDYDLLVIATGSHIRPEETPGMLGGHWYRDVFDFYTLEGATRLRSALDAFQGGRLVVNVVEMPIKCPVAPLEFSFLADEYFTKRGIRSDVELVYATPLDGAFTRPVASRVLGSMLEDKGIRVEAEFSAGELDGDRRILRSYDEREISYDLLVTVPTHMGAPVIDASGLGDELGFVPTHPNTLVSKADDHIFVIGDATDLPTSKAGSVAHFQSHVLTDNLLRAAQGRSLVEDFDGHANCFVESGFGKAMLIDFNYDVEPLPGTYPLPLLGPMSLLKETRLNHLGKLAFRWAYWNALLPGRPIPVPNQMSMTGKQSLAAEAA